jgi:hypothetical protein
MATVTLYVAMLPIALLGISAGISMAGRSQEVSSSVLDLGEETPLLTQRVNLAG